ncbi:hypothetical protein PR048_030982 [Dryococelus australis]|uniref:Uncharacterized protein n=1 Tax=Dryococelus australis TaxID=614101 RepID=A0ABQ9G3Z3_9NEOP|nr:hypothetical protein PR048_030982 [Dryococelus australis]
MKRRPGIKTAPAILWRHSLYSSSSNMTPARHLATTVVIILVLASSCTSQDKDVYLLRPLDGDDSSRPYKDSRRQAGNVFFKPRMGRLASQDGYVI